MHRNLCGVILDIDGTLIESNEAHALSWMRSLHDEGISRSLEEICVHVGMGAEKLLPRLLGISAASDQGKRLWERKAKVFRQEFLQRLRPTPGALELLKRMKEVGLKLGVTSLESEEDLKALLSIVRAEDWIFDRGQAPCPVDVSLDKLGTFPAETLMIGDTPYDIEAALSCGVQTIALRSGGWTDEEMPGAITVYDHPLDLLEHFETSPLGAVLTSMQPRIKSA